MCIRDRCSDDTTVTVLEPDAIVANTTAQDSVSCNGLSDGSASVTAIGGNLTYSYQWDLAAGGQSGDTATNLAAGTYTVTVTDQKGCSDDTTVTVLEPDSLNATILSITNPSCVGYSDGNATATAIGGTPNYTYSWTGGLDPTMQTASSLVAGTYIVTVTDLNGCSDTAVAVVSDPPPLSSSVTSTSDVSCFGADDGSIIVLAAGGTAPFNISWDIDTISGVVAYWPLDESSGTNAGDFSGNNHNATLNNGVLINQPGIYETAYSFDGVDDYIYVLNSDSINTRTTTDRSYSLNFYANNIIDRQVIWEEGAQVNGLNIYIFNGSLYAGAYSEASGWQGDWISHPISANTWYSISFVFSNSGSMELFVDGVSVSSFSGAGATEVRNHPGLISMGSTLGSSKFHDIGDYMGDGQYFDGFIDDFGLWNRVLSNAEVIELTSRPVISTNSPPGYEIVNFGDDYNIDSLSPGPYTVNIIDKNGCFGDTTVVINEPDSLYISSITQDSVSCNGLSDGSAFLGGITGGNGNNSFSWIDILGNDLAQNNDTATSLGAGTYTVTVTDSKGCSDDTTVTVLEPDALVANSTAQDSVSCNGLFDGSASVTAIGGNLNYTYQWDLAAGGQAGDTATNLGAGTYTVTVTDQKGCSDDTTVTVLEPDAIVANLSLIHI